jgi:aminomethyltransferase
MGEIEIAGPHALEVCQELLITDVARVQLWQAQYSVLCYPDGGCVADVIVYRIEQDRYLLCVNGANIDKDWQWITDYNRDRAQLMNRSDEYALIAVQGPRARDIVQSLVTLDLSQLRRYWSAPGEVTGVHALVARTGYTGEDGFELFVAGQCGGLECVQTPGDSMDSFISDSALVRYRARTTGCCYGNDLDDGDAAW